MAAMPGAGVFSHERWTFIEQGAFNGASVLSVHRLATLIVA